MKLYKFEIENFLKYLNTLKMDRTDTRYCVRFKKILQEHLEQLLMDISDINTDYAEKDSNDNIIEEDGKIKFVNDAERISEIKKLYHEEIVIDETEERKSMLLSIQESVINRGPLEFQGIDADWYDRFCEIVEQIKYEEN